MNCTQDNKNNTETALTGQLYLGVDGGGSKCRASIYNSQMLLLGTGVSGRANPLYGLDQTLASITLSTELALLDAGLNMSHCKQLIAGLGLAGVNVEQNYQALMAWQHPFAAMFVTTDLHTACIGAHNGEDGAVIITGTGSCGYAHKGDKSLNLGGHGFALGDKGSGAWLGLQAAQHTLLVLDGFAKPSLLSDTVLSVLHTNSTNGIVEQLAGKSSSEYAKLARHVLVCAQQQDEIAQHIVKDGAAYISELARKLFALEPSRFSMIGGLAEPLSPWLDDDILSQLSPALHAPEYGAAMFGLTQFKQQQDTLN